MLKRGTVFTSKCFVASFIQQVAGSMKRGKRSQLFRYIYISELSFSKEVQCFLFLFPFLWLPVKTLSCNVTCLSIILCINIHQLMKNCPTIYSFIGKYLKVDCIQGDLKAGDRATKRLQNADTKRKETCCKIPFFMITVSTSNSDVPQEQNNRLF